MADQQRTAQDLIRDLRRKGISTAEIAEELTRTTQLRTDEVTAAAERLRERTGGNAFFLHAKIV